MLLPKEFVDRMTSMLKEESDSFFASLDNAPIYRGIRINTLKKGFKNILKDVKLISWHKLAYKL